MNIFNKLNKVRSAGVSVEVALSIILAVGVLFLVLGLFNDNLKTMTNASGINRLFNNNNTATQYTDTHYTAKTGDYTNSQMNVEIVAEQGLLGFAKAKAAIELNIAGLASKPAPLSAQDKMELAKQLTMNGLTESAMSNSGSTQEVSKNYRELAADNNITINAADGTTNVNGQTVEWSNAGSTPSNDKIADARNTINKISSGDAFKYKTKTNNTSGLSSNLNIVGVDPRKNGLSNQGNNSSRFNDNKKNNDKNDNNNKNNKNNDNKYNNNNNNNSSSNRN